MSPLNTGKNSVKTVMTTQSQDTLQTLPINPSTSKFTASSMVDPAMGTVTVRASAEETETAIAALLTLESDLPQPEVDETAKNTALVPINLIRNDDANVPMPSTSTASNTGADAGKPTPSASAVLVHKQFVTVEYKLKRKC